MMNIVKLQDALKGYSDDQLRQEMSSPSGMIPQFLTLTELKRREEMRKEYQQAQQPSGTVAEEVVQAQPTGIAGLPDETMAGAVMRARMGGAQPGAEQPQPQPEMAAMAAGGAVQSAPVFGSLFGAAADTSQAPVFSSLFGNSTGAPAPASTGYAPTPHYTPKPHVPYKEPDYSSMFANLFKPPKHNPNPRVHTVTDADRYGLPKGMPAPTPGTQGLGVRYANSSDKAKPQYYWQSPEARDAYIRYMTPPAKPAATTAAPVAKAGGGPIYASGGYYAAHPFGLEASEDRKAPEVDMPQPRDRLPWYLRLLGGANMDPQIPLGVQAMNGMTGDFTAADAADILPPAGYTMMPGITDRAFLIPPTPRPRPERGASGSTVGSASGRVASGTGAAQSSATSGPRNLGAQPPATKPPDAAGKQQQSVADTPIPDYLTEYDRRMADILNRISGSRSKEEDIDNAIMQAALGIAGSTSPNVLGALTEGATAGFKSYADARSSAKENEAKRLAAEAEALTGSTKLRADREQNDIARKLKERELTETADYRKQDAAAKRAYYAATLRAGAGRASNDPTLIILQKILGLGFKATDDQQNWAAAEMKRRGMTAEDVMAATATPDGTPTLIDFEALD